MLNRIKNVIGIVLLLITIVIQFSFAGIIVDKRGKVVEETIHPTAESKFYEDTISDAERRKAEDGIDYSTSSYTGPSKNIISSGVLIAESTNEEVKSEYTKIRHTPAITEVDDSYYLTEDVLKGRLRLTISVAGVGEHKAKNGFYKVGGKVYYFDEEGLMVLGPAYDDIGNYYFFSYETGELLEEIQKR